MRILVVGSGGREHALVYRLAKEHEVICAPGNPGIGRDVELVGIAASDSAGLVKFCRSRNIDLVVVGPEDPLILGLADIMRESGIVVYGPGAAAARLEGSKAFSKQMMLEAQIPTAAHRTFSNYDEAAAYARQSYEEGRQLAVKVSGNALGRGVAVCERVEDAVFALRRSMIDKEFGSAGETVVLEERLLGREFSLLSIVGDHNHYNLPIAQDYKRALDDDQGSNTGGMGTFSPCKWASESLISEVDEKMVRPVLEALRSQGMNFRGTLFTGVMVTPSGPKCLEYNVRFGDPETQTVMMRLQKGFGSALYQAAVGDYIEPIEVLPIAAVTVVVASHGYPGTYEKDMPLTVGTLPVGSTLFFAGVRNLDGVMVNSGGRVVGAAATGTTVAEARATAYEAARQVLFTGAYFRTDIAADA